MNIIKKHATLVAIGSLLLSTTVLANPPKPNVFDGGNKWHITGYFDSTSNHVQTATQEICFLPYSVVGTSIQGVWYSTSYPDWNGRYYQEGDEVKMTGDFAKDTGHDYMTLIHTTYDISGRVRGMAFKDWTEWREDGKFGRIIGWGNATMVRAGRCAYPKFSNDKVALENEAQKLSSSLPERLTAKGEIAQSPGQPDLEALDTYLQRAGVQ